MVWRLKGKLDPDPLFENSTYIDKKRSKFVISLPAEQ